MLSPECIEEGGLARGGVDSGGLDGVDGLPGQIVEDGFRAYSLFFEEELPVVCSVVGDLSAFVFVEDAVPGRGGGGDGGRWGGGGHQGVGVVQVEAVRVGGGVEGVCPHSLHVLQELFFPLSPGYGQGVDCPGGVVECVSVL